jgi:hypothetical protein
MNAVATFAHHATVHTKSNPIAGFAVFKAFLFVLILLERVPASPVIHVPRAGNQISHL